MPKKAEGDKHRQINWLCLELPDGCPCRCHAIQAAKAQQRRPGGYISWNPQQLEFLRTALDEGLSVEEIADEFARRAQYNGQFVPRTKVAIESQIHTLGWSIREAYWSITEVAQLLGVSTEVTSQWAHMNLLGSVNKLSNQPRSWTRLRKTDVKAFVERWAGILFDPEKIKDSKLKVAGLAAQRKNSREDSHG
jgi:hypothetical protein